MPVGRKGSTRGTRRFQQRYGERLVCVRYRYDEATGKRFTTVELIAEEGTWRPYGAQDEVWVQVDWHEKQLREKMKHHGGHWDPERKLWKLRYNAVVYLGPNRNDRKLRNTPPFGVGTYSSSTAAFRYPIPTVGISPGVKPSRFRTWSS